MLNITKYQSQNDVYNIGEYTEKTYNYLIEHLDKDKACNDYKKIEKPFKKSDKKHTASEIYTYFLSHYFKGIDTCKSYEKQIDKLCINSKQINIIDIGANVGTVTFSFLDTIISKGIKDLKINIIFIELDKFRCDLLDLCIKKYRAESNLNIEFKIINKPYEKSVDDVKKLMCDCNTIILMSNILKWIGNIEIFTNKILENIDCIEKNYLCININIETTYTEARESLDTFYNTINYDSYRKIYNKQKMPKFNNIKNSYFYDQRKIKQYNQPKEYYHTCISNDLDYYNSLDINTIKKSYYKALHSINNFNDIKDGIETKYVNANLEQVINNIHEMMNNSNFIEEEKFVYRYTRKKKNNEDRPLYCDDLLNNIMNTSILVTKGIKLDENQDSAISFGNRIEGDINSPYIFIPYFNQYEKYKSEIVKNAGEHENYFKIDIKSYYSNIERKILKESIQEYDVLMCKWYTELFEKFIDKKISNEPQQDKRGIVQGCDMSHLLGNLYLNRFDEWFKAEYKECKLLRYVDDIIVFTNSEEQNDIVYEGCIDYLKKELKLDTHEESKDKNKLSKGLTKDIIYRYTNYDDYFDNIKKTSEYILRSLYKLDRKNYKRFKKNTYEFISIYQKCLEQLGIYLPKDWLNIKINKEESYLIKWFKNFKSQKKFLKWAEYKGIYDTKLKVGKIPNNLNEKCISDWYNKFRKKTYNNNFINLLQQLKDKLEKDLKEVLEGTIEDKSKINFLINKLKVFKINNMNNYINKIIDELPYCSKKLFANYKECNSVIIQYLNNNTREYYTYDYCMYIWILGEHKIENGLDILYDIFKYSFEDGEKFINTISTEAILKIIGNSAKLKSSEKFRDLIDDILNNKINNNNDYYFIRNMLLILNVSMDKEQLDKEIKKISERILDGRLKSFIKWVEENYNCNITELINDIPEEQKCKYPDYPFEEGYISL